MASAIEDPVTIVLAPIDQGVRNVGGRDGTREGPERLLAGLEASDQLPGTVEVARVDVENTGESLERDLDRLSEAVGDVLEAGRVPFVFGGDHGTTYATVRGAAEKLPGLGVAYLDVHLDMRPYRPVHTSGSSFRRLVEEGIVDPERVHPLGIEVPGADVDRKRTSFAKLEQWAVEHGVDWVPLDAVKAAGVGSLVRDKLAAGPWCFSLDADCIDERWAPGVSAPGPGRFTPGEARDALEAAAARCRVLDAVEYAPRLDRDGRTLETLVEVVGSVLNT